jgi:hypothetical protein
LFLSSNPLQLALALEWLKLHISSKTRNQLDSLFLVEIYLCFRFSPSVLQNFCVLIPHRYIRDFCTFNVFSSIISFYSVRCAAADNAVCRNVDLFGTKLSLFTIFYNIYILIIKLLIMICINLCTHIFIFISSWLERLHQWIIYCLSEICCLVLSLSIRMCVFCLFARAWPLGQSLEPRHLATVWASTASYRDSFISKRLCF